MKDKDYIKELFSEKLSNHEVPVRSDLWSGIQSQLGNTATTAAAAKGISVATKWMIGIASSVIVAGSVVWLTSESYTEQSAQKQLSNVEQEKVSRPAEEETTAEMQSNPSSGGMTETISETFVPKDGTGTITKESIANREQDPGHTPLIVRQAEDPKSVEPKATTSTQGGTSTANQTEPKSSQDVETAKISKKEVVGKVENWVDVFTPNNDKVNDYLSLKTENLKDFSITVMNDKNQVVFKSDNPDFKWDGTLNGEMVPEGNYIYMVVSTDTNGNPINKMVRLILKR